MNDDGDDYDDDNDGNDDDDEDDSIHSKDDNARTLLDADTISWRALNTEP